MISRRRSRRAFLRVFGVLGTGAFIRLGPVQESPKSPSPKIISNPKTPRPAGGKPFALFFREDLSIGEREGDENSMFGNAVYINADDKGNIYVTDWDRRAIRTYDSRGRYLLDIGRRGQGPGEFENVWRPEFDHDGNLYVSDYAIQKLIFFDVGGRFLRQIRLAPGLTHALINRKGDFVGLRDIQEESPDGARLVRVFGLFDGQFETIAEFLRLPSDRRSPSGSGEERLVNLVANGLSENALKPVPRYLMDADDFIWFGYPETYDIRVYAPDGRLDRIIGREYDRKPVSVIDKERYFSEDAEALLNRPNLRAIKNRIRERVQFPKYKPAYESFALMEDGGLAVIVERAENGDTVFDLFDRDGRYVSHFRADVPDEGLFFKNGKAYAVKTEDGYKFVKRYRIEIR